jgi:serine/threonine protein kinase
MTNADTSKLPFKFGPYYIFDYIGKGGMAEIFLAKEYLKLGIERFCVIKRILPALNERRDFCEMLINEAKICSNLSMLMWFKPMSWVRLKISTTLPWNM